MAVRVENTQEGVKPKAALVVERGGKVVKRLGPGSGFSKNTDGSPITQEQFEEFLGQLHEQGIDWLGITAGYTPDEKRGDKVVLYTNELELQKARDEARAKQAAEDIVRSIKEMVDAGDITFSA